MRVDDFRIDVGGAGGGTAYLCCAAFDCYWDTVIGPLWSQSSLAVVREMAEKHIADRHSEEAA